MEESPSSIKSKQIRKAAFAGKTAFVERTCVDEAVLENKECVDKKWCLESWLKVPKKKLLIQKIDRMKKNGSIDT